MTSLISSPGQINARVMYLKSLGAATEYTAIATINSVMTDTQWAAATTNASGDSNILYRDIGKRVTVVYPRTGVEKEKYAQVQIVNGSTTEGIPATYSTKKFVRIWSADGASVVSVARTG